MQTDITMDVSSAVETDLHTWRTRALNTLLIVTAAVAVPLMGFNFLHAVQSPEQWPAAVSYLILYLCVVGLAAFRGLSLHVRAWGLMALGYIVGTLALAFGGLAGDGRVFLLTMPLLALILIGVRAGLIMAVLGLLTFVALAVSAHMGWLSTWLLIPDNPLDFEAWLYEGIVVGMCLAVLVTLQTHLHSFLAALVAEKTRFLAAAQMSQNLYRTVTELTSDFAYIVRVQPDGSLVSEWIPESAVDITGYSPTELGTSDSWVELIYVDDRPIFRQHLQTILSGQPCVSEMRLRTKTGAVRWVRIHGQPVWDEPQEHVIRIYGAVQDITRHTETTKSLERRAAQLALLNDVGGKIAAVLDLDMLLDRVASLVHESFGYHHVALFTADPEQGGLIMRARAGDFAALFPSDHRIKYGQGMVGWVGRHGERLLANDVCAEPLYANFFPGVIPTRYELSVPIKVGQQTVGVLDVQSPHVNAFDENDVLVLETLADQVAVAIENARLYTAVQRELNERKQAEEALRESEEMARAILNATTESVLLVDNQGTILALNQTAAHRLGKGEEELTGLHSQEVVAHGLSATLVESRLAKIQEVLRSGSPARFEDERGETVFDTSVYPVFDAQGRINRVAIFARDVTARKRAEWRAAQAERLAVMGQLAAALAHEINNPLQAIRTNLELVQQFDLGLDEQRERLNIIRQEIERMAQISRRVLDFAHTPDDTRHPVSIAHLVRRTMSLVNKQLQLAHIRATVDCPDGLPLIFAAPEQITQVLLNLTVNAIEAMGDGGHLRITARAEGDVVTLAVTNAGPPIPEEHMERLFDPFFTTKPGGTGLGLSTCRSIVEQHGGKIRGENLEDGQGVTFTITLPIAHQAENQETVT